MSLQGLSAEDMSLEAYVSAAGLDTQCERVCSCLRDDMGVETAADLDFLVHDPYGRAALQDTPLKTLWLLRIFAAAGVGPVPPSYAPGTDAAVSTLGLSGVDASTAPRPDPVSLSIKRGDITRERVCAVVNTVNGRYAILCSDPIHSHTHIFSLSLSFSPPSPICLPLPICLPSIPSVP
ncbi:hypothetical protein KIPB_008248 [Kipferlia bialata]|uniref:Uncharacterized protein n=1 Tax=Kipferlia bialata TaxID=797122 RepID=A0A391NVF4_9EUKA|nr:hypothetical protein KIPB_008248 [Kipferlia bialata]|eukprot:g8248.t1